MQSLTPEGNFYSRAEKRNKPYEYGKNVALIFVSILGIASIVVAVFALKDARDTRTLLTELQSEIVHIPQPLLQSQKQVRDVCLEFQHCNFNETDINRNLIEQIENLRRQFLNIQNQTNILLSDRNENAGNAMVSTIETTTANDNGGTGFHLLSPSTALFNGTFYNLTSIGSWDEARQECQSNGGDLAVDGMKDYATRLMIARGMNLRRTWVGITDRLQEGTWVWVDGTVGDANDIWWRPGQPDNFNANEHCGEIWPDSSDYRMNDEPCNSQLQGLCEF